MMRQQLAAVLILLIVASGWWYRFGWQPRVPAAKQGEIIVSATDRTIEFQAVVLKDSGRVQFLLYADGYKWLEQESAIRALVKLSDLQQAISYLDWKVWDEMWAERRRVEGIAVWISHGSVRHSAYDLVPRTGLGFMDLIFVGSPYFDAVALDPRNALACASCALFPVEQELIRKEFTDASGASDYDLNKDKMPPAGSVVTITVRLPAR